MSSLQVRKRSTHDDSEEEDEDEWAPSLKLERLSTSHQCPRGGASSIAGAISASGESEEEEDEQYGSRSMGDLSQDLKREVRFKVYTCERDIGPPA